MTKRAAQSPVRRGARGPAPAVDTEASGAASAGSHTSGGVATRPALSALQDRFIATWGQMGSTWGISRTMAEVHALLYIAGEALCTDDVMERLEISRGNASMSLRALVDWGIITRAHKRGDRKEYFQAEQDPWTILRAVVAERMKREMHPVLAGLAELRDAGAGSSVRAEGEHAADAQLVPHAAHAPNAADAMQGFNARLDAMLAVLGTLSELADQFLPMPSEQLRAAASMLAGPAEPTFTPTHTPTHNSGPELYAQRAPAPRNGDEP